MLTWRLCYLCTKGIASFEAADFAAAAAAWLDSMKASRTMGQDGAKRALIALFRFLGEDDPVTLEYRRAFTSALY